MKMRLLFFVLLCCGATVVQGQYITTIAGNGTYGFGGNYGPATAGELKKPRDVAVDDSGIVYIADSDNGCIRKVDRNGIITTYAGSPGAPGYTGDNGPATMAQMTNSFGVGVDRKGNLYFTDYDNHCIRKVDAAGIITTVAGNGVAGYSGDNGPATAANLDHPYDVACDKWGNIYITEYANSHLRKVDTFGIITTIAGNAVPGFSGDGGPATAAQILDPVGITVDTVGNVFFTVSACVRKINSFGTISTIAGDHLGGGYSGDGGAATLAKILSEGIAVDDTGNIYLAEQSINRIRKVNVSGIISTIVGDHFLGAGYSGDGAAAAAAKLFFPTGVAIDASGSIYIADHGNNRIRKTYQHTVGVAAVNSMPRLAFYPVPCRGSITATVSSPATGSILLYVADVSGRIVHRQWVAPNMPVNILLPLPDGVYYIYADGQAPAAAQQLVISH